MALRIGFIGAGYVARGHRDALKQMDDVVIAAVCDTDGERVRAAAEEHGAKPYADWRKMLKAESLDALYICVPPCAHGEMDLAAVEKGLALFIEKPLAADWATAVPIARAVAEAGATVSVGYHWRYNPLTERAKTFVQGAVLGAMTAAWAGTMPGPEWWRRRDGSGGQVIEQATHMVDLVRYLGGAEAKQVTGLAFAGYMATKVKNFSVDDATVSIIELKNGVVASLLTSCMLPCGFRVEVAALTDRGAVTLEEQAVTIESGERRETFRNPGGFSPHRRGTEVFIEALRTGDASPIRSDYADAMRTFGLTCAIQASMDRGGKVVDAAEFTL